MEKKNLDWANLGFGYVKTDKRFVANYKDGAWDDGVITDDDKVVLNECAGVLQYAQTCFEGLKAYTTEDGHIVMFRPDLNAQRMHDSCERLEMPPFPVDKFVQAVTDTVKANAAWVPPFGSGATLYIRPYMFGSNPVIGVKPADEYQFRILTTPVGPYFKGGAKPLTIKVSDFDSINESAVLTLVSDTLRAIAEYSRNDRKEFIHTVQETQVAQQSADIAKKRRRLAAAQKRDGELEKLICKIYEDNALGKLPDTRYKALDAQYAKEQDALEIEIVELERAVTGYEQSQKSAEKFIALIDKYENFDTLTNTMLNEFVEKILVHERARKGSQDTTQEIEIYFNFLGRYIPPSLQPVPLTPEEQEELRKKEERKDRLHQNYLKRKASGAQKRYEDKIKAKKKAEMDAKKALIRAEDMKKGVFSTVGQLPKEEPRKGSIAASAAV